MSWSAPIIHATGDIVSASDWNISSNDLTFLNNTLAHANGSGAAWSGGSGAFIQIEPNVSYTISSGGTAITYPLAYTTWSIPIIVSTTGGHQPNPFGTSATGFFVKTYQGATQLTSGTDTINYIVIGL